MTVFAVRCDTDVRISQPISSHTVTTIDAMCAAWLVGQKRDGAHKVHHPVSVHTHETICMKKN